MKNLALKLLAFQKEVGAIPKNEENPFFKSKYADINTYIEVVKPILSRHGLVLLQPLSYHGLGTDSVALLTTKIIDSESGEEITDSTVLPSNPDPQKMGAIITYFRRYAIQSMLCLQAEDTDAQGTSNHLTSNTESETLREATAAFEGPEEPFASGPDVCPTCGAKMVPGKNGKPYCKPCYIKWANDNKK